MSGVPQPRRPSLVPAPAPGRRAIVVGAGSFGTAVAVLLARGGLRTTLQARTAEQAARLQRGRARTTTTCPASSCRASCAIEDVGAGLARADFVFLGVPSRGLDEVIAGLADAGLPRARGGRLAGQGARAARRPRAERPAARRASARAASRASAGPRTRRRWSTRAPGSSPRRRTSSSPRRSPHVFIRAGVVCEESNDPVGVELAGAAKNAAALAAGATEAQGLNAAGAAAGHIFAEVWRYAEAQGARPESLIGLAGTGDLVATALAPQTRNRRAGELLAEGVPDRGDPGARSARRSSRSSPCRCSRAALERAGVDAPVTSGLPRLIAGELPLDDWVALVRTTVPVAARRRRVPPPAARASGGARRERWRACERHAPLGELVTTAS